MTTQIKVCCSITLIVLLAVPACAWDVVKVEAKAKGTIQPGDDRR